MGGDPAWATRSLPRIEPRRRSDPLDLRGRRGDEPGTRLGRDPSLREAAPPGSPSPAVPQDYGEGRRPGAGRFSRPGMALAPHPSGEDAVRPAPAGTSGEDASGPFPAPRVPRGSSHGGRAASGEGFGEGGSRPSPKADGVRAAFTPSPEGRVLTNGRSYRVLISGPSKARPPANYRPAHRNTALFDCTVYRLVQTAGFHVKHW
jgi:hypothetical protein